ncbi:MAG: glycosyltransferase family 2 protein [Bacillota bacterium]|nr:glycosyltransferase family 2 protein [Bacillota bacterium]
MYIRIIYERENMSDLELFKKNICAIIVTFHPDEKFETRVLKTLKQAGKVVIVDNNSSVEKKDMLRRIVSTQPDCALIENDDNLGIAKALNQGISWAKSNGFEFVLLFDQDTVVEDNITESLLQVYTKYPQKDKIAVIGSNYTDTYTKQNVYGEYYDKNSLWVEILTVITSGSLIPIRVIDELGPFREDFFIDHVDDEFCLRAKQKGYKVILSMKEVMRHSLGSATMHKFLWRKTGTSNHSPLRRYYMTRNHTVLIKEYLFKEPAWVWDTSFCRLKSLILMCLFEHKRLTKLKLIIKGLMHGLFSKKLRNLK